MKISRENTNFGKIGKNIWHSHEDLSTVHFCRCHQIAVKALSWSNTVSGCEASRGSINITRTRHTNTLHLHYLSCWSFHLGIAESTGHLIFLFGSHLETGLHHCGFTWSYSVSSVKRCALTLWHSVFNQSNIRRNYVPVHIWFSLRVLKS
jgi:hypothetical protein